MPTDAARYEVLARRVSRVERIVNELVESRRLNEALKSALKAEEVRRAETNNHRLSWGARIAGGLLLGPAGLVAWIEIFRHATGHG